MTSSAEDTLDPGVPAGRDLRVLVVHNRYRSGLPSGENRVVEREIALLREAGVHVSTWIRSSDEIDQMSIARRLAVGVRPMWSPRDTAAVAEIIERDRPQILHLHNPYPLISPAVIRTAKRRGIAVVQTVHNYRHSCLNGLHLRDGELCTLCVGKRVALPGVRYGCYRGSQAQSAVLAAAEALHHPTWRLVDRFFALSDFMANQLVASGIPREKVVVKPNFVDDPGAPTPPGSGFLYAGRLEEAKGVHLLLDAWERSGLDGTMPLVIAGDGPSRAEVEQRASTMSTVEVTGPLGAAEMEHRFRACAVVVVPSLCFEGLPNVILEAFAHDRPVLATAVGALPDIVTTTAGWITAPEPSSLAAALTTAHGAAPTMCARAVFERGYERRTVRDQLLRAYGMVAS